MHAFGGGVQVCGSAYAKLFRLDVSMESRYLSKSAVCLLEIKVQDEHRRSSMKARRKLGNETVAAEIQIAELSYHKRPSFEYRAWPLSL